MISEYEKGKNEYNKPFLLIDNTKKQSLEDNMKYNSYKGIKITKRKDGRWQARFSNNGERKYIYGKTQKECYEILRESFVKEPLKIVKSISFYDYWQYWYKHHKEPFYKKRTLHNYKSVFEHQIKPNFKDKDIKQYTSLEINTILNNLENTRMKEFTCQYLREMFKQAYRDKKIKFDFWEEIKTYHHKRQEGYALTQEQRQILIKKAHNTIYDIFIFYMYTGCRPKEGLDVKIEDFENEFLHIHGTKTEKSDRWIPVLKPVKEIFDKYKNNNTKTLFNISEVTLKRRLHQFREICGFKFLTKDLRTTFATMCAEEGIAPNLIAKWLGHTTTNTTNKYYIKVLNEFEKEQIKRLDTNFDTNKGD